jgi:hypothetical protein
MKKETLALAAAVLAGAIASPALADVTAVATITKTKDVKVTEHITILKDISITGTVALTTSKAAEALALANIDNHNNKTDRTIDAAAAAVGLFSSDAPIYRVATINNSIDNNHGSVGVNQDTGNDVNQANLIAYGLTDQGSNFTNGEASVDQSNTQNVVDFSWTIDTDFPNALYDVNVTASMSNSVNHNTGVVGVNQNSGNNNNQTNAVALAAGLPLAGTPGQGIALAEADLGQENTHNTVHAVNVSATATIDGSISNNTGIVGVNQAVGNNSNEANVAAVGAAIWKP